MTVNFKANGDPLDDQQIDEIEEVLGVNLPKDFRNFLLDWNVAKPEENQIITDTVTTAVHEFFGRSDERIYDLVGEANAFATRVPKGVLPIASTPIGDLICLQVGTGAVYLWEHEEEAGEGEEPSYDNMELIAPTFTRFLQMMVPRELLPKSEASNGSGKVWKAPGFDEKFKDYLIKK